MKRIISTLALAFASVGAYAQLPVGSVAPDFTLTDINGKTHHLYSYLDSGYAVIIDVSAAWCGPCWSAHTSHVFENLTDHYGKNGTTTPGKVKVIFIEGEAGNTGAQITGTSVGTGVTYSQGDWTAGTNYPIIDNATQNANYLYGGYPSFTVICRDRLVAMTTAGYSSAMGAESWWMNIINAGCPSYPPSTTLDAKAVPYGAGASYVCTPSVKIQNYSATQNLTSATINIKSGSTTVKTQSWTGNLAPMAVTTVPVTGVTGTAFGPYTFEVVATGDSYAANNASSNGFNLYNAGNTAASPWSENFEAAATLPNKMSVSGEARTFTSSGTYVLKGIDGASTRGMMFAFPEMSSNEKAEVILGNFNTGSATNVALEFDLAHANASGKTDQLDILVSTDCGSSWKTAWTKSGAALGTAPVPSAAFVPTQGSDWRHESASLSAYKGTNVVIKAVGTSKQGHYVFIDNLQLKNTLSVQNVIAAGSVSVYPNPAKESATLEFTIAKGGKVVVNVVDAVGRTVAVAANATMAQGAQHVTIPTSALAAGVYNINIQTEEGALTQRLTVVK